MSKMINYPLGLMIFLSFISVVFGNIFIGKTDSVGVDGSAVVDGETSTFSIENTTYTFNIDNITGIIIWIIVIIGIVAILGFNILGSGLGSSSVRIITILTAYYTAWIVFSILATELINLIPYFNVFLYVGLTVIFTIGIIKKINNQ